MKIYKLMQIILSTVDLFKYDAVKLKGFYVISS